MPPLPLPSLPLTHTWPSQEQKRSPTDVIVREVQQRPLHVDEVLTAKEAFVTSSSIGCVPITSLDGKPIADGERSQPLAAVDTELVMHLRCTARAFART